MKIVVIIIFVTLYSFSLMSETLVLKDGTIIKMTLKTQDADTLTYTLKGKEFKVPKNKVRRVVYAKTPELEEKMAKEEVQKIKLEKSAKKVTKTLEEEQEESRLLDEEIARAIEEQKKQELLNLSFEERIKRLEEEVSSINIASGGNTSKKLMEIERELKELQKRTRRIERFLEIDPEIEDYYSKPRSMWSIVWRSALVPGWGLSYGREGNFDNIYTLLFFLPAVSGVGYKAVLTSTEKKMEDKFVNDFLVQPFAAGVLSNSPVYTNLDSTFPEKISEVQSYNTLVKLNKYLQTKESFNAEVANANKLLTFAAGVYVVQLIHSAIYGYFWAQRPPIKFWEEKQSNFRFNFSPTGRKNPLTNEPDYLMEAGYRIDF